MALKGPLRLLAAAYADDRKRPAPPTAYLAGRALELGLAKVDRTRGHLFQAIGAAQVFLAAHPIVMDHVKHAPVDDTPWELSGADLQAWLEWFATKEGDYGNIMKMLFPYNYDVLRNVLTTKYGGNTTSGGGANNELELALRLVARYFG